MGLFGKLFDKKECDICGGEIGLLGNRKLEDGNCCKDCAKKLSPWMTDRRKSTVEDIKQHILYREKNEGELGSFNPSKVIGTGTKVYIDEGKQKFLVTRSSDWRSSNPDIIDISQVSSCNVDVKEDKKEIYSQNTEGKRESYSPPRYEHSYRFMTDIFINSPWFSEIQFELTDDRPDSRYTQAYREYERQADELVHALDSQANRNQQQIPAAGITMPKDGMNEQQKMASEGWTCFCGEVNQSNFCAGCGAKKPAEKVNYLCDKCGWKPESTDNLPKFCPQCGDPFNANDIA